MFRNFCNRMIGRALFAVVWLFGEEFDVVEGADPAASGEDKSVRVRGYKFKGTYYVTDLGEIK